MLTDRFLRQERLYPFNFVVLLYFNIGHWPFSIYGNGGCCMDVPFCRIITG
jgi:hypothetical protein